MSIFVLKNPAGSRQVILRLAAMMLVSSCALPGARAQEPPPLSVRFEHVGQVCLSAVQERQLLQSLSQQAGGSTDALTLIAYSDQVEMRSPNWHASADCVKSTVPSFLVAHERIAWLRAMGVVEFLRANRVPGFSNEPRLVVGPDAGYRNLPGEKLAIVLQRSSSIGPTERRLDILRTSAPASAPLVAASPKSGGPEPPATPAIAVGSQPTAVGVLPSSSSRQRDQRSDRLFRVATLTAGLTGLGLGVGFLAGAGAYHQQSLGEYSTMARLEALQRAEPFWHTGGWSLGLGAGITAFGISLFLLPERTEPDRHMSEVPSLAGGAATVTATTEGLGGYR